ncbi:diguanylate cyclase (GGDEF) domain-containing protein [Formivibrio citricus]|uniref:diguanylate cyclase n=1 Tax=Formivibrio citricus TaxID=83765 RepID=A0A1I4W8X1_9NEIS|nr:diguanylate cyclase [Formivibrio citricus]SFN10131.1 diguanylate cyclase (GGDEF) domain-containing protein [Formivibrio citricus]
MTFILDPRTVVLMGIFIGAIASMALHVLLVSVNRPSPGLRWWSAGLYLMTSGMVGFVLRDLAPDWITYGLSTAALLGGHAAIWIGLRRYTATQGPRDLLLLPVGPLAGLLTLWMFYAGASYLARVVVFSLFFSGISLLCAATCLKVCPSGSIGRKTCGHLHLVMIAISLLRVVLLMGESGGGLLTAQWSNLAVFALTLAAILCSSFCFLLMNSEWLLQQLEHAASHDDLTGILNRRAFLAQALHRLEEARRLNVPLSLVMLDIDHFKQINDSHGHQAGDMALKKIAQTILEATRNYDLVARVGGEEFMVLLPHTDLDSARAWSERIRQLIGQLSLQYAGQHLSVAASFGVTQFVREDSRLDMLMSRADRALYVAKESGRNRVCVG